MVTEDLTFFIKKVKAFLVRPLNVAKKARFFTDILLVKVLRSRGPFLQESSSQFPNGVLLVYQEYIHLLYG